MKKIKVFIAGDSTAATKMEDKRPETGWGEKISNFFTDEVEFFNHAVNGRSTKSFMDEGRLQNIEKEIGSGDFLFIEFGHNDEKPQEDRHTDPFTTYKANLLKYIDVARKAGATPVLLTPTQRRSFGEDGKLQNTHGDYPKAMMELAKEFNVKLIDITAKTTVLYEKLGDEASKKLFLWVSKGESPNYPEGVSDNTHFCDNGATEIARLVFQGIVEENIEPLVKFIKAN